MLANINSLFYGRNEAIKFMEDYSSAVFEATRKPTEGEWLKLLTPTQMVQRLPIALAEVKASNNSENVLNEIRQIVYSFYQSKDITKKVYNNTIKSIQI